MAPENPGPCYTSRAFAMTHIALYDAYVGITGEGATYHEYSAEELAAIGDIPGVFACIFFPTFGAVVTKNLRFAVA